MPTFEVFRAFPEQNIVAWFTHDTDEGEMFDIDAPRNAPAKNPELYLDRIKFHSSLNYLAVAFDDDITIDHAAVSAATPSPPVNSAATVSVGWGVSKTNHLLLEHDLGYVPHVLVAVGNNILYPGMPVQTDAAGGGRYVTVYVDENEVRLYEYCSTGNVNLAAASRTYRVLVFEDVPAPSTDYLMDLALHGDHIEFARGQWSSSKRYLQVSEGGSPLALSYGPQLDLANGAPRFGRADGTVIDPIPSSALWWLNSPNPGSGSSVAYDGSFAASDAVEVQAPDELGEGLQPRSFIIDPVEKQIVVTDDGRTVITGADKMVGLLPQATERFTDTINVSFPDFSKGWLYRWAWQAQWNDGAIYDVVSTGQTYLEALPQEYTSVTKIADVPPGADLFMGRIRINRISSPSHNWGSQPIDVLPIENKWLPFNASCLLEAELGMGRGFSIYIESAELKLKRQQSVANAPTGFGAYGDSSPAPVNTERSGGEWRGLGGQGVPIWAQSSSPYLKSSTFNDSIGFSNWTYHRWDGADPASTSDPTNYSDNYQVEIVLDFGRRS